jgi:hypothetical protein
MVEGESVMWGQWLVGFVLTIACICLCLGFIAIGYVAGIIACRNRYEDNPEDPGDYYEDPGDFYEDPHTSEDA